MKFFQNKFFSFLKLIRLPNLLLLLLAQVLVRYFLIIPAFETEYAITGDYPPGLDLLHFLLLVLSTLLITAGGYVINDVFDVETDAINKPGKNQVNILLSPRAATRLFYVCSCAGILLGFYLAVKIQHVQMGFIHVFAAFSLYMYASRYKRQLLSGNILVAVLCALGLLIPGLFEPEYYRNIIYLLLYSVFAFLLTLIREIVKDLEDYEGDLKTEARSLPVVIGFKYSKLLVLLLITLLTGFTVMVLKTWFFENSVIDFWNLAGMFIIPFLALGWLVYNAKEKKDYFYASLFSKIIMLAGVLTMIPFYYYFMR